MARPTAAELQAAKRAKAEEREAAVREAAAHAQRLTESEDRYEQLNSVAGGLYEELDKQARKWPTMPVTARTVERSSDSSLPVPLRSLPERDVRSGRRAVPCGLGKLKHAPPMARTSLVGHALACHFPSRTAPLGFAAAQPLTRGALLRKSVQVIIETKRIDVSRPEEPRRRPRLAARGGRGETA